MKLTCSNRPRMTYTRADPAAGARGPRHLAGVAGVDRRVGHERDVGRPGQHAQVAHRDEHVVARLALDLDDRVLAARGGDHELRAPVDPPPDQPAPQRRLVERLGVLHADAPVRPRDEVRADVDHGDDSADSAASSAATAATNGSAG